MKNLALGIYRYGVTHGHEAYGWRLVELLPHIDRYAPEVQRVKQLATMHGFKSREGAIEGFEYICDLAAVAESLPIEDVPHYGWAPREV